jgi:hypothetical protein
MRMQFMDDTKKFSCALGECWSEFISKYLYAAEYYKINPFQKFQYFHHLLRDNAKRFNTRRIQGNVGSYSEASNLMEQGYNSISRWNRISNHLKSLGITQYVSGDCNTSDALEKLHAEISKLAPQGPMNYRSEEHRIEYLCSTVIDMSWARAPLSRVNVGGMSNQELFSQLESSVQQERDEKAALFQDSNYGISGSRMSDKVPGIFFNGQARYGREILGNTVQLMPFSKVGRNVGIVEVRIIFWEVAPNKRISQTLQLESCNSTTNKGLMMKRRLSKGFFAKFANKSEQMKTKLTDTKMHPPTFKSVVCPKVKFQMMTRKLQMAKQWNSYSTTPQKAHKLNHSLQIVFRIFKMEP